MGEGRKVVLKTDLEIKEEAKREAKIAGLEIDVFFTMIMFFVVVLSEVNLYIVTIVLLLILWIVLTVVINLFANYIFSIAFEQKKYAKRSIAYVNANLSAGTFVKVKNNIQEDFIQKLQDKAEFYAIINEKNNLVEIWIKFNSEEEVKYEDVSKEYFYDYYSIQE